MIGAAARKLLEKMGYTLIKSDLIHGDIDDRSMELCRRCQAYTLTTIANLYALNQAVRHVVETKVEGDLVECGVWKGGSSMMMALTLMDLGEADRAIWLYDTYAGMTRPQEADVDYRGEAASGAWEKQRRGDENRWCNVPLDQVRANLSATGFAEGRLRFIEGDVRETLPKTAPGQIALLRLDTDWYESTYHELRHLFPLLSRGGILLVDDYGYWRGARKAVDQYFQEQGVRMFLGRIDIGARIGIKT